VFHDFASIGLDGGRGSPSAQKSGAGAVGLTAIEQSIMDLVAKCLISSPRRNQPASRRSAGSSARATFVGWAEAHGGIQQSALRLSMQHFTIGMEPFAQIHEAYGLSRRGRIGCPRAAEQFARRAALCPKWP